MNSHILEMEAESLRSLLTKLQIENDALKAWKGETQAQVMLALGAIQYHAPTHTAYDHANETWMTETVMPTNVFETMVQRLEGVLK